MENSVNVQIEVGMESVREADVWALFTLNDVQLALVGGGVGEVVPH